MRPAKATRSPRSVRSARAIPRPRPSISATWSRTARASTSSGSTCAATAAPAITSSAANSISAKATPTTGCSSIAPSAASTISAISRRSASPTSRAPRPIAWCVNVDVEDQSTGAFSVSGGYSTSDGFIGEVSVSESNFLGRGQFVRVAGQLGQRSNGVDFSFTEPYFLGYRMAAGIDLFSKFSDQTKYARYENRMTGGQLRLGLPFTEEFTLTLRYSLYQQDLQIPNDYKQPYNDCSIPLPGYTVLNPDGTPNRLFCESNGEASLAIKESQGQTITSLAGLTFNYNTLDSTKDPRNGFYAEAQDGFCRSRRRFPLLPRDRRRSLLPRAVGGYRSVSPAFRAARSTARWRRQGNGRQWRRPSHRRPVLPRPVARSRLRHQRHRPARHFELRHERQRHRRHDLFRWIARSSVPDLRSSAGTRPEGRGLRRCRYAVRL